MHIPKWLSGDFSSLKLRLFSDTSCKKKLGTWVPLWLYWWIISGFHMADPFFKLKQYFIYLLEQESFFSHVFVYKLWHKNIKIKTIPILVTFVWLAHVSCRQCWRWRAVLQLTGTRSQEGMVALQENLPGQHKYAPYYCRCKINLPLVLKKFHREVYLI